MPELPEVESVRRALEPRLVGHTIARTTLHRRDVLSIPGDPPGGFARNTRTNKVPPKPKRATGVHLLSDARIDAVIRRGKQLVLRADDGRHLLVHLGMSGRVFVLDPGARIPPPEHLKLHVHATWRLDNDERMVFIDPRRFGGLRFFPTAEALKESWAALGPDALTIDAETLASRLRGRNRSLKACLLDQQIIAGLGNIYVDESCFLAGISPLTSCTGLGPDQIEVLASSIRRVLSRALEAGGSTLRDFVSSDGSMGSYQSAHAVYGRGGLACVRCGGTLEALVHSGRTTVYCPSCQADGLRPG